MDRTNTTLDPIFGLDNSSSPLPASKCENWTKLTWVKLVCFTVIVTVGLIGNFGITMAILKRPKLRIADYFVLNLASTDLATCIISVPFDFVVVLTRNWPFGSVLCKIVYPLQTIFMAVSVYTLLFMSWERHRVVMRPSKPNIKTTRTLAIICLIWVASIAVVGPYFAIPEVKGSADGQIECDSESGWPNGDYPKAFTLAVFILLYLLPLLMIAVNYVRISQKLWIDLQRLRKTVGEQCGKKKPLIKVRAHRNMRIVKVFVIAVIAFAACMAPNHVMWLWHDYGAGKSFTYFECVLVFCHILVYANSAINPFVFMFLHSRYCKEFLLNYCRLPICCKDTESLDNNHERRRSKRGSAKCPPKRNAHGTRNYLAMLREEADQESPKYYEPVKRFQYDLQQELAEDSNVVKPRKTRVIFKAEKGARFTN